MTASFRTALSSIFLLIFISTPALADSKRYFIAPDISTSNANVNAVDVSSGRLSRSDTDISSSTLSFSRIYSESGWSHQYSSRLWVDGLSYSEWHGAKSGKYKKKKKACTSGWNDIKSSVFNGKLSNATAKYKKGYCQIRLNGKTKARFVIHRSGKKANKAITLTRPDGSSMTFAKSHSSWKPLSGAPYNLKKSGRNWKLSTPSDNVETYDRWGSLTKVTKSNGQSTHLHYNHAGKLKKVTGAFGRTLTLTYNGWDIASVTGAQGTVSYTYTNGRLTTVTNVDGSTMTYQYDNGKLSTIVDALEQTIARYTYDNADRVATSEGQNGTRKISFSYASSESQVTNVANNTTDSYKFKIINGTMKLAKTTDSDGNVSTQSYDKNGYPRQSVAINGTKTRTIYNKKGLLIKRIESVGLPSKRITLTHWHNEFRKPILQVDGRIKVGNKATKSVYNNKGLLVKRIEGIIKTQQCQYGHHSYDDDHHGHHHKLHIALKDKRITQYRYNSKAQLTKTIAPNGAITLTSYDSDGNRTGGANALGHENRTLSFDATGKPLVSEDTNGIQTSSVYDNTGRLSSTTSNGHTTNYTYDVAGRETSVTYPDGSSITNEYDATGNLTKTTDKDGNININSFDSNGNQTSTQITDGQGNIILSSASEYNNKNQLVKSTDAQGNTIKYEYDTSGNQIKTTDSKGNVSQNEYDANNRLVKTTDALGGETSYSYDSDGNGTSVTSPNGANTIFEYDSFNQLTKEISPDRGTTTYQYDSSGNQISITDANGNQKNISYDVLNRKTGESWTGAPDLTIAYTYDSCANGVGKLCAITDKSGSTSFDYDAKGQITQKTQNIDGIDLTKTYAYNNEGKLIIETYPSGAQISYGYNVDKISSININDNPYIIDVSYNGANQLTGWKWADGTSYTKTYDSNGRLASFPLGNETRTLNYDANGNITGWSDTNTAEVKNFTYDALNRLTAYNKAENSNPLQSQLFSYDANGNRLSLVDNSVQTIYNIMAESNRLTSSQSGVEGTAYQYDANGNIIDDGEHTYSYDSRNRLTGVDGTSSYLFNINNMRVKKTTPAGTTLYGWDNDRIFAEYDQNGTAIQETVYFGSTPIALLKDGNTYKVFADQIDTPRVLTDNSNAALWAWDSKPFGESQPNEDADGDGTDLSYNLRFPGQYYDNETEKYYNFNRDYNPVTGRYSQSDPIGLDGGINTFGYVSNNPLNTTDSSGLQPTWVRAAGRKIDISIDIHNEVEKNDALGLINAYKGQIYFTVYIYSRDTNWLPELKAAGALVGLHANPRDVANPAFGSVENQINKYFGTYRWAQPVSIHGLAGRRLETKDMNLLLNFNVPFVRAADNTGSTAGNPSVKLTHSTCHTSNSIIAGAEHYFFHTLSSNDGCKTRVGTTLSELGFTK